MEKLPGDYVAGFVGGEGCFALKFRRDVKYKRKNKPVYYYWDIEFVIMLHANDKEILHRIRFTLGCGRVDNINSRGYVRYSVNDISDLLNIVVPFFEKYPLHAKKSYDFELWKEALNIFRRNQKTWDDKNIKRLEQIHNEMRQFKGGNKDWKWLKPDD